jgi:hypothetical protein
MEKTNGTAQNSAPGTVDVLLASTRQAWVYSSTDTYVNFVSMSNPTQLELKGNRKDCIEITITFRELHWLLKSGAHPLVQYLHS